MDRWHIGPWTMRVPQCSRDELHMSAVVIAQNHGFELDPQALGRQEKYRSELDDAPLVGTGRLANLAEAGDLEAMAYRAVEYLQGLVPGGSRFWLTDGLYLLPAGQGREHASVEAWPSTWTGRRPG